MSNHRQDVETEIPAIFASRQHVDQVAAVEAAPDHIQLSLTPAAAAELARVMVQYGSVVRTSQTAAPSEQYDAELWHDVGLALQSGVTAVASRSDRVSRYVDPRHPASTGRRRKSQAPLTIVGGAQ